MIKPKKKIKTFNDLLKLLRYVEGRNLKLTVKDFKPKITYEIEHMDGSKFLIKNPLLEIEQFRWSKTNVEPVYIIYSEHHNPFVYPKSDLKKIIRNNGNPYNGKIIHEQ